MTDPSPRPVSTAPGRTGRSLPWPTVLFVVAVVALLGGVALIVSALRGGGTDGGGQADGADSRYSDDFERSDTESLGSTPGGVAWEATAGEWGIDGGAAVVRTPVPAPAPRSLALLDLGGGDGEVSVRASRIAPGWGIVFRYQGPFSYWTVVAVPDRRVLEIQKVKGMDVQTVGELGPVELRDGLVLGVRFVGPEISFTVDGRDVGTLEDPDFVGATKVGITVLRAGAEVARWDDFTARPLGEGPPASPAPASSGPAPSGSSTSGSSVP